MASQKEVAEHMDLSVRSIRNLVNEGVIPGAKRNEWDLKACTVGYIRHLRQRTAHGVSRDLSAERARLASAQADRHEIEVLEKRRELIPVDTVASMWARTLSDVKAKLLGLPSKLAPQVIGKTREEARAKIEDAIHDSLRSLAETAGRDTDGVDASSETERESVGRRVPKTKPRSKRRTRAVAN